MSASPRRATIDDLHRIDGKAELVAGRIVTYMPSGYIPAIISMAICEAIREYSKQNERGLGVPRNVGFVFPELTSGRESFCPDAAFYTGPLPHDPMDFITGPPDFAVEVRSKMEQGRAAFNQMVQKINDYFEAGTLVVWDVDPDAQTVSVYRATAPNEPAIYSKGQSAEAEPAMPGWTLSVDTIFA